MFYIQDPTYKNGVNLQELLLKGCEGAIAGGGAYAFASKGGVKTIFGDEGFRRFLERGHYTLIVGMDDITDEAALTELAKMEKHFHGHLEVRVYIHHQPGVTFHPKFSWFQRENGGVLIVGSGNMTLPGMGKNREAYFVHDCDEEAFRAIVAEWRQWYDHSRPFLHSINDPAVTAMAKGNRGRGRLWSRLRERFFSIR